MHFMIAAGFVIGAAGAAAGWFARGGAAKGKLEAFAQRLDQALLKDVNVVKAEVVSVISEIRAKL